MTWKNQNTSQRPLLCYHVHKGATLVSVPGKMHGRTNRGGRTSIRQSTHVCKSLLNGQFKRTPNNAHHRKFTFNISSKLLAIDCHVLLPIPQIIAQRSCHDNLASVCYPCDIPWEGQLVGEVGVTENLALPTGLVFRSSCLHDNYKAS